MLLQNLKLNKSKGLSVEIPKTKFDPKSIDEALEKSRNQFANIIPVTNRAAKLGDIAVCLLYTSPSPRDMRRSRMPSSA